MFLNRMDLNIFSCHLIFWVSKPKNFLCMIKRFVSGFLSKYFVTNSTCEKEHHPTQIVTCCISHWLHLESIVAGHQRWFKFTSNCSPDLRKNSTSQFRRLPCIPWYSENLIPFAINRSVSWCFVSDNLRDFQWKYSFIIKRCTLSTQNRIINYKIYVTIRNNNESNAK